MTLPRLLLIETSTRVCSIAIAEGEKIIAQVDSHQENDHAAHITLYIQQALTAASASVRDIDAVAVSIGPGSYTGLRIGLSTAKGICCALGFPLLTISTLESFARHVVNVNIELGESDLICAMMDAGRMEVYAAIFDSRMNVVEAPHAHILTPLSFAQQLGTGLVHFTGNGAAKARTILSKSPNARWYDDFVVSAGTLAQPAYQRFINSDFADLAYSEPFYLKEFLAAVPKVKGLH